MVKIAAFINHSYSYHSNTYVLYDSNKCVLVDPNRITPKIEQFIDSNNLKVVGILLTHAHFDHITALDYFQEKYNVPVYVHEEDVKLLNDPKLNASYLVGEKIISKAKPETLTDGQNLNLLEEPIITIHTPFHTAGSCCFYLEKANILVSGDTLFNNGYGRFDLPTGDRKLVRKSLDKLSHLPKNVIVYPGHGDITSIGREFLLK